MQSTCISPSMGAGEELRVIIVGGSIAGLSCAHALLRTGICRVMVLEKASSVTAAGAGLGLDMDSCEALEEWGLGDELKGVSQPLDIEENRAVDSARRTFVSLARDEQYRHRAAHWSDLHRILCESLPPGLVQFGHEAVAFEDNENESLRIKVTVSAGEELKEVQGDLLVAADGYLSRTRNFFVPNELKRYSGYCAWRGVLDYSQSQELKERVCEVYTDLAKCLYFEIARGSHAVLYELPGQKLNWLWYVNQPEPTCQGNSATFQPDGNAIAEMWEEAGNTWVPPLVEAMKATPKPFINAIYDRDPLKQFVWGRVVLVGEAAHPTSPHGLRSTNMAIQDARVLGQMVQKRGVVGLDSALIEYQVKRISVTSKQVLYSRHMGQLKQGMLFEPAGSFPWPTADDAMVEGLLQRNMNYFQWKV